MNKFVTIVKGAIVGILSVACVILLAISILLGGMVLFLKVQNTYLKNRERELQQRVEQLNSELQQKELKKKTRTMWD